MIVAEYVFVDVTLQILCASPMINPINAALNEASEALNSVGMNIARYIDFCRMHHAMVCISKFG